MNGLAMELVVCITSPDPITGGDGGDGADDDDGDGADDDGDDDDDDADDDLQVLGYILLHHVTSR